MKKIIIVLIIAFIICIAGYNSTPEAEGQIKSTIETEMDMPATFVYVENTPIGDIWCHTDTKIMYLVSDSQYNHGVTTIMLNVDGKPLLWKGKINE